MFLGVVQGWSVVLSCSRHTVLNPCLQYLSSLSKSRLDHGVTATKYRKFPTALSETHDSAIACFGSSRWPLMVSFTSRVLSYTRSFTTCMFPLGVSQNPRYRTGSDSGSRLRLRPSFCYPEYHPLSSALSLRCSLSCRSIPRTSG